jgi:hypothetical protein
MARIVLAALAILAGATAVLAQGAPASVADRDLVDAYEYMLGRWLVLRQEALDLKQGLKWNEVTHREPGGVTWANPNLDVAYSEAWIYIDETSCTLVDLPPIKGRYYTVQVLNGWGEVTANINERTFPRHPSGTFGLCLKGAKIKLPAGAQRVELPNPKSRVLMRIELGADQAEAIALQKKITMKATGAPKVAAAPVTFDFPNNRLPGVEGFDKTEEILASEPDINAGMMEPQRQARAVARAAADPAQRARLDEVIRKRAIPVFMSEIPKMGRVTNGWIHPRIVGNYRGDYLMRSIANFTGIWANNAREVVYFAGQAGIDGNRTYTQTFPANALPASKARYFWSVVVVDGEKFQVIPNPLNRYLLNKQSALEMNDDGSLTLAFGPKQPAGIAQANWLPTPAGKAYNMTYRFYGPSKDVTDGTWYPPPLVRK